ncbi:MAG: hypothetical protein PHH53_03310, partial [Candidatus Nanoarchaeia archaeon]|nr:hypothetical protein [Candidatus Nanoarchaeia archaeon]
MKLNNKSIKIILLTSIFILLSLGIAYASGAFLGGSDEVSLTKGLVGHWKLDEETYDEYTVNLACNTFSYYAPYHTVTQEGTTYTFNMIGINRYLVIKDDSLGPLYGRTFSISGFMKKNG